MRKKPLERIPIKKVRKVFASRTPGGDIPLLYIRRVEQLHPKTLNKLFKDYKIPQEFRFTIYSLLWKRGLGVKKPKTIIAGASELCKVRALERKGTHYENITKKINAIRTLSETVTSPYVRYLNKKLGIVPDSLIAFMESRKVFPVYELPREAIEIMLSKPIVDFDTFQRFSELSKKRTKILFKRLSKIPKRHRRFLRDLLLANMIAKEKSMNFTEIAKRFVEICSSFAKKKMSLLTVHMRIIELNKLLKLRSEKDLTYRFGGHRKRLSPKKEEMLRNCFYAGLSISETTRETGVSRRTVETRFEKFKEERRKK